MYINLGHSNNDHPFCQIKMLFYARSLEYLLQYVMHEIRFQIMLNFHSNHHHKPIHYKHLSRLTSYSGVAANRWEYSSVSA